MYGPQGYVRVSAAARQLGLHRSTVYKWVKEKKVQTIRVGSTILIETESLRRLIGPEATAVLGV